MKKILFILLISSTFISCMEVLDIDALPEDKKLTLNSLITPDSLIKVNLSTSISSLDGDAFIKFINDADVKLYEDDQFVEKLQSDTFGYFISTIKPNLSHKYSITAQSGDFPILSAQTDIPKAVPIKKFEINIQIDSSTETWYNPDTQEPFDTTIYTVNGDGTTYVSFDDPANETNYYLLSFSIIRPQYFYDNQGNQFISGFYDSPINYQIENSSDDIQYFSVVNIMAGFVFNDNLFSGSEKFIKSKIYTYELYDQYTNTLPRSPLYVHLYTLSKDLYDFIISYNKYESNITNPFSEPVNIFSNIKNGLGLLAGFNVVTDSTSIGDLPTN